MCGWVDGDWGVPTVARCLLGRSESQAAMIGWELDLVTVSQKGLLGSW